MPNVCDFDFCFVERQQIIEEHAKIHKVFKSSIKSHIIDLQPYSHSPLTGQTLHLTLSSKMDAHAQINVHRLH